ncbi:MAG: DUF1326 domain-containing protein [Thermoanaerobaculia bacterium]
MRARRVVVFLAFAAIAAFMLNGEEAKKAPDWAMNATIIEACSCPMFCQCYFNAEPAEHHDHAGMAGMAGMTQHGMAASAHYCKFNNALRVNHGNYGDTKLDGAKFWVAGDLGADFSKGKMDYAVLTFDASVTPAQRDGIKVILGKLYPVEWNSFTVAKDAAMDWSATKEMAAARLDGGKTAEVVLSRGPGMNDESPVIKNLRYWGAPRNEGFVLMPNKVEAYRAGDKPFEFGGTNGFMITFDITSKDFPAKPGL